MSGCIPQAPRDPRADFSAGLVPTTVSVAISHRADDYGVAACQTARLSTAHPAIHKLINGRCPAWTIPRP